MNRLSGTRHKVLWIVLVIIIFTSVLTAAAFWRGLVLRTYDISSAKVNAEIRIAVVSDLHGALYGAEQEDILRLVKSGKPDLILLAGDIIDDIFPLENSMAFMKGAVCIAPCYYVTGSHDLWYADYAAARQRVLDMGVIILEGDTVPAVVNGQTIFISGIDDPTMGTSGEDKEAYSNALQEAFSGLSDESFHILVAHRPDYMDDYARYAFDLVVSGHTHGGQVRIPFLLNGLYAPDQGWFPRYSGGLYMNNGVPLVVSRGVSYYPKLPRIFNPPEVVIIHVSGM